MSAYNGKYKIKNLKKYKGNPTQVFYRSSWELSVMLFCDTNPQVKKWSSESIVIPYLCPTDNRIHKYFPDFWIEFSNNEIILVEIKPMSQTKVPQKKSRTTKKFINEVKTYAKNSAKWKAADEYAKDNDWKFQIWTEETLKELGINLLK